MWAEVFERTVKRRKKYASAEDLANVAKEYFQWVEDNPFYEEKAFAYMGEITKEKIEIQRPYTLAAFCLYAGITDQTFRNYDGDEVLGPVCEAIRSVVDNQKFEGAASNIFNANIISRDLGLADKQDVKHSGGTTNTTNVTVNKEDLQSVLDLL